VDATFAEALARSLSGIPRGRVATCSTIARALGDVRAARAVATWLREHPETREAHRVVRADGRPVLDSSVALLKKEGASIAVGRVESSSLLDPLPDVAFLGKLREEQRKTAVQVVEEDAGSTQSVTGVDIAYRGDEAYAAAATLDVETLRTVAVASVRTKVGFPYIPGYLAFREMPGIETAVRRLAVPPEAVMIDGHGRLHPALFGVACHAGVRLNVPTIGVAKHPLAGRVDTTQEKETGAHPVRIDGKTRGYAWIPPNREHPIYISVGHRVSLGTALALVKRTTRVGYPEPLRIADRLAEEMKGE